MQRTLRYVSVGAAVVAVVAAVAASSAFAAPGHRGKNFGPRNGMMQSGFGPMGGGFLGIRGGGQGLGGQGFGGFGGPPPGMGGPRGGGGGLLGADVLTPASAFLGVSLSTLESDLAGGKTLAQEATAKSKTAADLIAAIVASEKTVLDAQKAAGWLTDAQETSALSNITNAVTDLVNNGPAVPPSGGGQTSGPIATAATYLGMSVSDLQAALKSGKTLADEATANGKTVDGLVQALIAPAKAQLDTQVTAGDITAAQETTILNHLTTQLTNMVNGTHGTASVQNSKLQKTIKKATTRLHV